MCGYFLQPTPGKPNESSGPGFAPKVVFSHPSGSFMDPFALDLSCHLTNAVIRYTLDGSTPTATSALYTGPITISATTTVNAIGLKAGLTNSAVASATYTIGTAGNPAALTSPSGTSRPSRSLPYRARQSGMSRDE